MSSSKEATVVVPAVIYLILDGSGSMSIRYNSVIRSVREFVSSASGTVIMYMFSKDIKRMKKIEDYECNGNTALYDAIIYVLNDCMGVSAVTPLSSVTIVVFTDGEDNCSKSSPAEVKELLDECISSGLKISYVGSNQDASFVGGEMGVPRESILAYDDDHFGTAMRSVSDVVNRCITGEATSIKFDDEVRKTVSDSGNPTTTGCLAPVQFKRSLTTSGTSNQFNYYGDTVVNNPEEAYQVRLDCDSFAISRCLATSGIVEEPPSSPFDYYGDGDTVVYNPEEIPQVKYNSDDDFEMISRCLTPNPGSFVVSRSIGK